MSTAFATASSNATLPVSIRAAEGALGLRPQVSRFVLTAGASANQNGLALYEGVTVLFLAQSAGVDLNLGQQALVAGWCVIGSLGTAGSARRDIADSGGDLGLAGSGPDENRSGYWTHSWGRPVFGHVPDLRERVGRSCDRGGCEPLE